MGTPTSLREAIEQRGSVWKKMDELLKKAETEKRMISDDEAKDYDTLEKDWNNLDAHVTRLEAAETRNKKEASRLANENRNFNPGGANPNEGLSDKEEKDFSKFSIMRGLALMASGKPLDGIEKEVSDMASEEARMAGIDVNGFAVPSSFGVNKRGQTVTLQTTNPGDQGGKLVQTDVNEVIEALWAQNFLSELGATRLSGLQGDQLFPVQLTKPTIQSLTEIQQMTDDEILWGEVKLTPQRRGTTIPISKQLILQASIDVQKFVMDSIRKALDNKMNADAITELLSIITAPNNNLLALGANGAAPTYDSLVALEGLLAANDADKDSIKYLSNPKVRAKLKTTQLFSGTNGDAVWSDNELNGYPAVVSNIVPSNLTKGTSSGIASAIIMGNFSDLYVGLWGGMDFVVDPYSAKRKGQIEITANMFWHTKVVRPASFAGIKDALTT